jgi:MOSC domain-containing protein YiiM
MRAMLTINDLEIAWRERPQAPRERGTVRLICVRKGEGRHETPDTVQITPGLGLVGDRWSQRGAGKAPDGYSAVTLMNATVAELLTAGRQPLDAPGDNLHVDLDISVEALPAGTRLRAGTAVLEVSSQPHTGCSTFSGKFGLDALKWVSTPEGRQRRLRGVNCAVISGGQVRIGDPIEVIERPALRAEPTEASASA